MDNHTESQSSGFSENLSNLREFTMSPLLSRSQKRSIDITSTNTPQRLKTSLSNELFQENSTDIRRDSNSSTSSFFEDDRLMMTLKSCVKCSRCEKLANTCYQTHDHKIYCQNCKPSDEYKNTVTRNIAVEKVVSELLQPASQLTPQKNKRSRRLTESKDRNNNFLSAPTPNTPSPQRQFRQRSYTVPHSIVLASQHYEQHKQELGSRVQKWLVCSVCLDTVKPFKMIEDGLETDNADKFCAMKQCENGHLICEKCLDRLLADAALKNTEATCPFCRTDISQQSAYRNMAVEKILASLPVDCETCFQKVNLGNLSHHDKYKCPDKIRSCIFSQLGCKYAGKLDDLMTHYSICTYFNTPAKHLQPEIRAYASDRLASQLQAENNLRLYSKRLAFVDFGLQAKRTEGEFPQVFYASGNISALGHTFSVRMHVSGIDPKNPTRSTSRRLEYQILLKSQLGRTLDSAQHIKLNHVMVTPPPARYVVRSTVYEDTLSSVNKEGNKCVLNLSAEQINMVLSSSSVTFRLFLFLA